MTTPEANWRDDTDWWDDVETAYAAGIQDGYAQGQKDLRKELGMPPQDHPGGPERKCRHGLGISEGADGYYHFDCKECEIQLKRDLNRSIPLNPMSHTCTHGNPWDVTCQYCQLEIETTMALDDNRCPHGYGRIDEPNTNPQWICPTCAKAESDARIAKATCVHGKPWGSRCQQCREEVEAAMTPAPDEEPPTGQEIETLGEE